MVPAKRKASLSVAPDVDVVRLNGRSRAPERARAREAPEHERLGISPERCLQMYEAMLLARLLDERQWILNRQGLQAFHISCQGHEASGVGSAFALDPERDVMVPYYRSLGAVVAFGVTPR
ncbi:MAG: hypothetical protein JOZ81_33100, partial [Chloroflexi bacterium]|nr:hypothetical protein [Chloroflexota bacterium]